MHHDLIRRACLLSVCAALSTGCDLPDPKNDSDTDGSAGESGNTDTGGSDESGGSDTAPPPTERAVDIVFVVDNSGSMGEEQAKLVNSISTLVDTLDAAVPPVDYRIAVTTTDSGNPWCQGTGPEAGEFRSTSCRTRPTDFVFEGATSIDATEEACLAVCDHEELGLSVPWIEVAADGSTNAPEGDVKGALGCLLPQGINGCGFEQPLESLSQALARAENPGESNFGFLRPGALLAVAVVTDEVDCSYNHTQEAMFLPEGNRVFWSDPSSPAPTSAVCWNAGVECTGSGPYDCSAADKDLNGNPVAGDPALSAALHPLSGYIDDLSARGAYVIAINGVAADGAPVYADSAADPQFQFDFGIGAGCASVSGMAVPPVRMVELVDTVTGPGNLHSVCNDTFDFALTTMGQGILSRLP